LGDTLYLTNPHVLARKMKEEKDLDQTLNTQRLTHGRRPYHSFSHNYEPLQASKRRKSEGKHKEIE
jgi:hypothetical protein